MSKQTKEIWMLNTLHEALSDPAGFEKKFSLDERDRFARLLDKAHGALSESSHDDKDHEDVVDLKYNIALARSYGFGESKLNASDFRIGDIVEDISTGKFIGVVVEYGETPDVINVKAMESGQVEAHSPNAVRKTHLIERSKMSRGHYVYAYPIVENLCYSLMQSLSGAHIGYSYSNECLYIDLESDDDSKAQSEAAEIAGRFGLNFDNPNAQVERRTTSDERIHDFVCGDIGSNLSAIDSTDNEHVYSCVKESHSEISPDNALIFAERDGDGFKQGNICAEIRGDYAPFIVKNSNVSIVEDQFTVESMVGKKVDWSGKHPDGKCHGGNGWYVSEGETCAVVRLHGVTGIALENLNESAAASIDEYNGILVHDYRDGKRLQFDSFDEYVDFAKKEFSSGGIGLVEYSRCDREGRVLGPVDADTYKKIVSLGSLMADHLGGLPEEENTSLTDEEVGKIVQEALSESVRSGLKQQPGMLMAEADIVADIIGRNDVVASYLSSKRFVKAGIAISESFKKTTGFDIRCEDIGGCIEKVVVDGSSILNALIEEKKQSKTVEKKSKGISFNRPTRVNVKRKASIAKNGENGKEHPEADVNKANQLGDTIKKMIGFANVVRSNPDLNSANRNLANQTIDLYNFLTMNQQEPWNPIIVRNESNESLSYLSSFNENESEDKNPDVDKEDINRVTIGFVKPSEAIKKANSKEANVEKAEALIKHLKRVMSKLSSVRSEPGSRSAVRHLGLSMRSLFNFLIQNPDEPWNTAFRRE